MFRNNALRVVMFSAEAAPFAKEGGLGDVVGALPKELKKLGVDPAVIVPGYAGVFRRNGFEVHPCKTVASFDVRMGDGTDRAEIFCSSPGDSGVETYFIGSKKYFDRPGIYNDPDTGEGYRDNARRFIFFMKAGIELLVRLKRPVDVIHCHDSQAALMPGILRTQYGDSPFWRDVGTLFTIHNLAYQGIYAPRVLQYAGIDSGHFYPMSPFEYWNKVNFMKAGILLADKVNTVSRTYALEIQSSHEFGQGLEGVLQSRKTDVSGIVNGIDYEEWNPETDPRIPANFSSGDVSGKAKCRKYIQKRSGLPVRRKRSPLIGIVSRLADQKGLELVAEAAPRMASLGIQLVILGVGQQKYHTILKDIASRFPRNIALHLAFDEDLAHGIAAGCDMYLMPSRFEPCGLSQLIGLRYGSIPIVRATGGLVDTVKPYDGDRGTGFVFEDYSAEAMMQALNRALSVYADADRWMRLMARAMAEDWSWKRSAQGYRRLYRSIYLGRHPKHGGISASG